MKIDISEQSLSDLVAYAQVPIGYEVREIMDVEAGGPGGFILSPRRTEPPYFKDYDAIAGEGPLRWAQRFDLTNWGILMARVEGRLVGGTVIAFKTAGVTMLEGRDDLAVLWDIRVAPEVRGQGVGSALFRAAEAWAAARGCTQLKIETQNVNVPACRFYQAQGCVIEGINRWAYPELPEEIQILWKKTILKQA